MNALNWLSIVFAANLAYSVLLRQFFSTKTVSVQSTLAVFVQPRLPNYDKMVMVFFNFGDGGSPTHLLINEHFISFALEM